MNNEHLHIILSIYEINSYNNSSHAENVHAYTQWPVF